MRVVIANPGKRAYVADIDPGLESMQRVVGGLIELWAVDGAAHFLCNEEGRLIGLPLNRFVTLSDGTVWDIYGPILVVGGNAEDGTFTSLPEAEAMRWVSQLNRSILRKVSI
ncbi:DUF3846 domain-containing protein [Sulfobacillus harzensis]|uniref:DUF3846 domain-containing protein n=1 Tax=Sulfobacillus harzensis TaxID=2729629 RepID=A0A7Y0Q3P7_9FIRM|nr:DUF3846 domain-containing protein [Sulfobacillus harzensis]NMP24498.1 DUF3846 domain-containing protein [Sulfobacillus harzensis]